MRGRLPFRDDSESNGEKIRINAAMATTACVERDDRSPINRLCRSRFDRVRFDQA